MSNDLTGQVVVSRSEQLEAGDAERQSRRRTGRHGGHEGQGRGQCQVLQGRDAGVNHCSGEELFGQPRDSQGTDPGSGVVVVGFGAAGC